MPTSFAHAARHLLGLAAVAVATAAVAAPLPLLRITDLSAASGLPGSRALDINNHGVASSCAATSTTATRPPSTTATRSSARRW